MGLSEFALKHSVYESNGLTVELELEAENDLHVCGHATSSDQVVGRLQISPLARGNGPRIQSVPFDSNRRNKLERRVEIC